LAAPVTMATHTGAVHHEVVEPAQARQRQKGVTRLGAAVLVVLVAGCSSVHASVRGSSATPKAAAIALGHRMLDEAVLPSGAHPFTGSAPTVLNGPSVPGIGNLVLAHRLWAVAEAPHADWQWLQAHVPHGFVKTVTSSGTDRGVPSWGLQDDLSVDPPNISTAELQFSIAGDPAGHAVIRVDTVVGWTEPRPTDEFVAARDRSVIVSVIHSGGGSGRVGKRVVSSDPKLVQPIVDTFNRLPVEPPNSVYHCPSIGPRTVSYRVAFAPAPTAPPDLVATIGKCGPVEVIVNGRSAVELDDLPKQALANDVSHVLGFTEPHFG
jgi:hypothetical protein